MRVENLGFGSVGLGRPPVANTFDQVPLAGSKVCRSLTTCPVPSSGISPVRGSCKIKCLAEMWSSPQGGLSFKAHRLLYHSTLGSRVIEKKTKAPGALESAPEKEIVRVGGWGERLLF